MAKKKKEEKPLELKHLALGGAVTICVMIILFLLIQFSSEPEGEYDKFARCIVDSGAKMYSAWWCSHCQNQKDIFGDSFKILEDGGVNVECSPDGIQTFSAECLELGIRGTPTWRFSNGNELGGFLTLPRIAEETGCEI